MDQFFGTIMILDSKLRDFRDFNEHLSLHPNISDHLAMTKVDRKDLNQFLVMQEAISLPLLSTAFP